VQVDFELVVEQLKHVCTLRGHLVRAPAPVITVAHCCTEPVELKIMALQAPLSSSFFSRK
jgi:hypothetical protein